MTPSRDRQSISRLYRRALLDFIAIAAVLCGAYYLISDLDLFEVLNDFSRSHENWELDELIVAALLGVVGVSMFGMRRLLDLQREIKVRAQAEQTARRLAQADPLTGLANRRHFEERLTEGLSTIARSGGELAVMMIDLDNLKPVNDAFGHAAGDRILTAFAQRASRLLGRNGLVARMGGDEFAAIVEPPSSDEEAVRLGQQLLALLDEPLETDAGTRITASCSIGIAIAPGDGASPDTLIRRADIALYRAKQSGRRTCRRFVADMDAGERRRTAIGADLHRAIADGTIRLFYQPILDLSSREITGFEAIARWHHPVVGDIPPREFTRIAEDSGLIGEFSSHLLRRACADAMAWPQTVRLGVNLSRAELADPTVVRKTIAILADAGFDPQRLEIEVSEAALLSDIVAARATLTTFHQAGIAVALDDFGSVDAGIGHLRQFHFDRLKIGKSLIDGVTDSKDGPAFVGAILGLARELDIPVTAEGIEREETVDRLFDEGCGEGQGLVFGAAMPAEDAVEYLSATPARDPADDSRVFADGDVLARPLTTAMAGSSRSCMPNARTP